MGLFQLPNVSQPGEIGGGGETSQASPNQPHIYTHTHHVQEEDSKTGISLTVERRTLQRSAGYYFMRRAWLSEPPEVSLPDPAGNPGWYGEFALVYPPSNAAPVPMNWPHTFRAMCQLRVIMNQVAHEAFRDHHPQTVTGLPRHRALEIQSRLREWYEGLPGPLQPKVAVFPSHLRLQ